MATCKCGISNTYPECDSSHKKIIENEKLRKAILDAYNKYESEQE